MIGFDIVGHGIEQIIRLDQVLRITTQTTTLTRFGEQVALIRAMDVLTGSASRTLAASPVRHGNYAVTDLEPCGRCSVDNHPDCFMPQLGSGLAGTPGLPLGAHRRHQDFDLDDVACCLRIDLLRYHRLPHARDFYA